MNTEDAVRRDSSYIKVRAERLAVRGHTFSPSTLEE